VSRTPAAPAGLAAGLHLEGLLQLLLVLVLLLALLLLWLQASSVKTVQRRVVI
jgi:uncharacterized membrane protein (Fun14 family)